MVKSGNKPKILFVQESLGQLSEVFLYRLLMGMHAFNVKVLAGSYVNRENFPYDADSILFWNENISIYGKIVPFINRKLKTKGAYASVSRQVVSAINKSDADLVCFQFAFLPVQMGSDLDKINKKTCVIHHGTDVNTAVENKEYHKRLMYFWSKIDKIIFVSHFLRDLACSLGCPKEKTVVNYLGVPLLPTITTDNSSPNHKVFKFICVARMSPVKNHINLIHAFTKVVKQVGAKNVQLTLVGSGELKGFIEKEIATLKLSDHVDMTGGLNNEKTLQLIAESDCSVLVSKVYIVPSNERQEEGLPISLLEGAALGLPLIGSHTGGIPEIIDDGKNGYLVDPLDVDDIANSMLKIMSDRNKSKTMGKAAKHLVEEKFNLTKQNRKFEEIFMDIIN